MIHVSRAGRLHTGQMADILNEIIVAGGTTAYTEEITADMLIAKMRAARSAWHIAEDNAGEVVGFQWIAPYEGGDPEIADIATFARIGRTGLGIGSALFRRTTEAAKQLGYLWINATIRADNGGGLAYYQSRGFEDVGRTERVVLDNGLVVDKIHKRYDLRS